MALHELEDAPFPGGYDEAEGPDNPRGPEIQGSTVDPYAGYQDYFGFDETNRYYLPDGKQYIEFRPMSEGQRAKFEKKTSRDLRFNRRTDDASIKVDTASDRHELIMSSVINWSMVRRDRQTQKWEPVAFTIGSERSSFNQWLLSTNPQIVNDLHSAIVKANPWMSAEMTVEMIDEEILKLQDMRKSAAEREASEKDSANR